MTGRSLTAGYAAALQAAHVTQWVLVEMYFDSGTLYIAGLPFPFTYLGNTYLPALGLGTVQQIIETDNEVQGLSFTISGVPEASISLALSEPVQGRRVVVRQCALVGTTVEVDDSAWEGQLDVMTVDDSGPTATITVTAEHALAAWAEPRQILHSHEDQQLISPGDMFYEYASGLSQATLVWPDKNFGRV